ncbi:MAG: hypothetical protein KBT02_00210 [Treponema sp.]|nr:hypothetical protein [Candidatus Treponema caballi]
MNLRQLAEKDLAMTLEDSENGFAVPVTFTDVAGNEYKVNGNVDDIGYLLDLDGNAVAGRTVCAVWRMSSMVGINGRYAEPGRGWRLSYSDLSGREWTLYVTRFEPDRTLGVGRVWLSLDLS